MGSFRRKRFTPYLGWWALYLFDVCHGWSVAYLKCFFFYFFLGCTALCDGLSNMYHAAYIQGTLQKEEPISPHCSAVVFTCVPCHVPGCIWRILTRQKTSVSRVPITLLQETSVADENSFYSCTTVIIVYFLDWSRLSRSKPVCPDREIMLSSIWTRNIACYFFFTYLVDGRRNLPTLLGFWIINPSSPSGSWLNNLAFVGQNFILIDWAFCMQSLWLNGQTCSFNTALDEGMCVKTCNISWVRV